MEVNFNYTYYSFISRVLISISLFCSQLHFRSHSVKKLLCLSKKMSQMFAEIQDFVVENSSKLSTTVALVVVSLSIFVWWRRHLYVISWKCHGPVYKPLFGNIFDFGTSAQSELMLNT